MPWHSKDNTGWTDERVELLKKLVADGLSGSQIAAGLGGITRNAVIGKMHRLGLSGRPRSASSASPRPRKARPPQATAAFRPAKKAHDPLAGLLAADIAEVKKMTWDEFVDSVPMAKLHGAVIPLHQSGAFPPASVFGGTEAHLIALASMYRAA